LADIFTFGRPVAGVIGLFLQLTVIGCLPATIRAVYAVHKRYQSSNRYLNTQKISALACFPVELVMT
jgi:hypothetical protein